MKPIPITDPTSKPPQGFALFALGFRPFFLAAGLAAVLLIALWLLGYSQVISLPLYYGAVTWHAHEMLFGYVVAVVAGFLLTAVRNWTDIQTSSGLPLALLALLWLLGRVAPFIMVLPPWLVATLDLAFLPLLAIALAIPILRVKQYKNLIFVILLTLLTIANLLVHLQMLGVAQNTAHTGIMLAMYAIVLIIVIMGGRVIPFFVERGLDGAKTRTWPWVEYLSIASVVAVALVDPIALEPLIIALVAGFAAVIHAWRLSGWVVKGVGTVPLLWVLLTAYAWIVTGFVLLAFAQLGWMSSFLSLHAFTTGGMGIMTLGMMSRVALGHTGRMMQIGKPVAVAFFLLNIATLIRVVLPMIMPEFYTAFINLAGVLWIVSFGLFVFVYVPILTQPRVDGMPG